MEMQLSNQTLAAVAGGLAVLGDAASDVELLERVRLLETVKNAAAAAQARAAVALRELREEQQRSAGRPVAGTEASVSAEIALARRESPHRGRVLAGLAMVLLRELPHTMSLFSAGEVSEYRAMLVARETACLSRADRGRVDAALAGELPRLADREIIARARQVAYQLDPLSVVERASRAEADRRVTIRPAPDTMALVSALLPVAQGVALYAALAQEADRACAAGDPRSRGQVMADTLVCRATGQAAAQAVPVEVQLVISDEALLGDGEAPARLVGYGPIPAGVARRLTLSASKVGQASLRRLYARHGRLVALESKRRRFPKGLRRFVAIRDEVCRTPWCGAPIRHIDHAVPARLGGATSAANGQGLCEQCNQVKEHPGWRARPGPLGAVTIITPNGDRYASLPPPLPDLHYREVRLRQGIAA
ncbi:MAG: DUF222 domain-containing protein [Propionicimonas sp.]|uniref:HNH endonuclease n=1 Tax=Propionicimonas sp. TaxID=1955623 RepID=UPI002B216D76|nr:DUF222 domain-containing protein [Propionicimonas sp.]MEA4944336.1 DUF222 domain-containing protein [Propionicimonas sp.]